MACRRPGSVAPPTALLNACRATLGLPSTTPELSVHVRVCDGALRLPANMWFVCVANSCACHNGVPETGVGCPANGVAKCASCNPGWTINHAKTACICTCANVAVVLSHPRASTNRAPRVPLSVSTRRQFSRVNSTAHTVVRASNASLV